jgi:hypothetical protein
MVGGGDDDGMVEKEDRWGDECVGSEKEGRTRERRETQFDT